MKIQRFTISGSGPFPFDMLRYDYAFPATQETVALLQGREKRSIVLERFIRKTSDKPTFERWLSFGWRVDSVETY